ncbi:MAG: hypothetical protein ACOWWO_07450 [Peptococcaceae bacterium]
MAKCIGGMGSLTGTAARAERVQVIYNLGQNNSLISGERANPVKTGSPSHDSRLHLEGQNLRERPVPLIALSLL